METTETKKDDLEKRLAVYVRLKKEEFEKLLRDSFTLKKSKASLLRKKYFKGESWEVLMPECDARAVLVALSRIGTNVNQIARHLNSGIKEGFNKDLVRIAEELTNLRNFIGGYCGNR